MGLSKQITMLPFFGEVNHALVWVAIISALGGTVLLAAVGFKLPGIEYDIQKEEAAYRKELVLMRRLGFDPAQSSAIFLIMITDAIGLLSFLGFAALGLKWLQGVGA